MTSKNRLDQELCTLLKHQAPQAPQVRLVLLFPQVLEFLLFQRTPLVPIKDIHRALVPPVHHQHHPHHYLQVLLHQFPPQQQVQVHHFQRAFS